MRFEDLEIIEPILKALKEEKYVAPTPIQEKAIPLILNRNDVLGNAQTGTGKTAAFAIPILQHLFLDRQRNNSPRKINALIITPTRELAIQIAESFSTYGKYTGMKNTVIFGGVTQGVQKEALRNGVDILVATPGRLLDLMDQGFIRLKDVEYFVLDEADRMLDMGFINDIRKIIAKLPSKRQSLFFSATMPDNIVDLSRKILNHPIKVEVSPVSSTAETIHQYLYYTNKSSKNDLLFYILQDQRIDQVLLFSRTKHGADKIARNLKNKKIKTAAIHGNKAQNQRQIALKQFKDGEIRVLVATDIAARGIDIDKLKYVINYDIPNIAETYVHRIGRSGRAGDEGISISICEPEENAYIKSIEKLINQKIEIINNNPFPQTDKPMTTKEKQVVEKEKTRKKHEYFTAINKNKKRPNLSNANRKNN
jgi:ATP-dependent RNA helicase RhlE